MQFRVTVPKGVAGGQTVTVKAMGAHFNVRVPKGVKEGDAVLFELSQEQLAAAKKEEDTEPLIGTTQAVKTPIFFHDYTDLGMALCLGFVIGLSIVFGFVLGVLFVTDPLYAPQAQPST